MVGRSVVGAVRVEILLERERKRAGGKGREREESFRFPIEKERQVSSKEEVEEFMKA